MHFTPHFFDTRHGLLYAVHHFPGSDGNREHGVLLLPPLGQEYVRCHKTLQKLASDLARQGFHALRFDYIGSGDSARSGDWDLQVWRDNALDALQQLRALSGAETLSAVGVRLGASLALGLEANLDTVVLWDPVGDGGRYLAELMALNQDLLISRHHSPRRRRADAPPSELVGHAITAAMQHDLQGFRLNLPARGRPRNLHWIDVEPTPAGADFAAIAGHQSVNASYARVDLPCNWNVRSTLEDVMMGQPVARHILQQFTQEADTYARGT
jgi:uncharacterized protein